MIKRETFLFPHYYHYHYLKHKKSTRFAFDYEIWYSQVKFETRDILCATKPTKKEKNNKKYKISKKKERGVGEEREGIKGKNHHRFSSSKCGRWTMTGSIWTEPFFISWNIQRSRPKLLIPRHISHKLSSIHKKKKY